ncbi:MAG: hypothetical protein RXP86_09365 [Acidilobus sp.]
MNCNPERPSGGRRPDIRCYYRGFNIVIETSYNKNDAEKDAKKRIDEDGFDIAIALWLKEGYRYHKDLGADELEKAIRSSKFDVALIPPPPRQGLLKFITKRVRANLSADWFVDVDLNFIKELITSSIEYLIAEKDVEETINEVNNRLANFITALRGQPENVWQGIYDILYRLYGLRLTEVRDAEVIFGQAGLSILLSSTFYEHVRALHGLRSLSEYVREHGPIEGLCKALNDLLQIDYRTAIETTVEILKKLPTEVAGAVNSLVELGMKIAQDRYLLRRDFAGRVYHRIVGDIVHRKGFATFYTEVPAAYLLATLAVNALLGTDERPITKLSKEEVQGAIDRISSVKVGDFACGSGTLITAAYSELMDLASAIRQYHRLGVNLDDLGKKLIEEGVYGIDALRYASQITAINLALIGPSGKITRENVFTIYLGIVSDPKAPYKGPWLGSLELLNDGKHVGGLLAYIEGGLQGAVEKVSVSGVEGTFAVPDNFDLIIMNPPFTRATGRTETYGEEGERGLFGFVADEKAKQSLLDRLNYVRDRRVRQSLIENAKAYRGMFPNVIQEIIDGKGDLDAYLSIGQAGEGLLFLYLAHRFIRDGGVIAFVIPRNLLMGVSWFLARVLLATKYHLKYVVVSSDPENGYNFSEGTSLSEVLIVAKRQDKHSPDEETVFINLLRKPRTGLEAVYLANMIMDGLAESRGSQFFSIGNAVIYKVKRADLIMNVDNWGRFVALPDIELIQYAMDLINNNEIKLGGTKIQVPMTRLNDIIISIGIDRHQYHNLFNVSTAPRSDYPYPVLHGGGEEVRRSMIVKPNAYAQPKESRASEIYRNLSGRVLLPDRIWWPTMHVSALYSETPVLSNIFYAVRLRVDENIRNLAEKSLVLWLNSIWGLLSVFINIEETRGLFTSLKTSQWRLLPVLNVTALDNDKLKCLAETFDKYASAQFIVSKRLIDQLESGDRLNMDADIAKCLGMHVGNQELNELRELYRRFGNVLNQVSGSGKARKRTRTRSPPQRP